MKTAMTFSILSKCHTITSAAYSIKYHTYHILFWIQLTIRLPSACCILTCIFKVIFRVQFTLDWPSWSTYSPVADDGFQVSRKQRCADTEKFHVKPNTFGRFCPLYFISHVVMYIINSSPFDNASHTETIRRQWKPRWHSQFFGNVIP